MRSPVHDIIYPGTWAGAKLRTDTPPTVLVIDDVGLLPWAATPPAASSTSSTTATKDTPPGHPPTGPYALAQATRQPDDNPPNNPGGRRA